jgi:hypothetical protein
MDKLCLITEVRQRSRSTTQALIRCLVAIPLTIAFGSILVFIAEPAGAQSTRPDTRLQQHIVMLTNANMTKAVKRLKVRQVSYEPQISLYVDSVGVVDDPNLHDPYDPSWLATITQDELNAIEADQQAYLQSVPGGYGAQGITYNGICGTVPAKNCEFTSQSVCANVTLPPKCNTSSNCFTAATGCTNNPSCRKLTLPPQCTVGSGTGMCITQSIPSRQCTMDYSCGLMTMPPKCNTAAKCITSFGVNCATNAALCQKITVGAACQTVGQLCMQTFNTPDTGCQVTAKWACVRTDAAGCTASTPACVNTVAVSCLTFKGKTCPTGPVQTIQSQQSCMLLIILSGLGLACMRSKQAG